jgi:protocatechuate 3,4-dioxygenase beta subunit
VTVRLTIIYDNGVTNVVTTVTDADGFYSFGNLLLDENYRQGSGCAHPRCVNAPAYVISVSTPAGYLPTLTGQGTNDKLDSDNPNGTAAALVQGETDVTAQPDPAVETDCREIRLRLRAHRRGRHRRLRLVRLRPRRRAGYRRARHPQRGRALFDAVTNTLIATRAYTCSTGSPTATTAWRWLTTSLPVGPQCTTAGTTNPHDITLAQGERYLDADFGYVGTDASKAIIGDRVWADYNGNGVQDPGEVGIAGVLVVLRDLSGTEIARATTGPAGDYLFTDVAPGSYVVEIDASNFELDGPLEGYTVTSGPQSEGDEVSAPRTLIAGDIRLDVDFGYNSTTLLYTITDKVWLDTNANGEFDAGDTPLANVTVSLLDSDGNVIGTTRSDAEGNFTFSGVPDGDYRIVVTDNAGQLATLLGTTQGAALSLPVVEGGVDVNGDGQITGADNGVLTGPVDLGSGVEIRAVSVIGGLLDLDGDGQITSADTGTFGGVQVIAGALDINGDGEIDADDARIAFPVSVEGGNVTGTNFGYTLPGVIGDRIWSDANGNGVQDPGESGIGGVQVQLYLDADNDGQYTPGFDTLLATTTTDASGNYLFAGLPAGTYFVVVTPPAGYTQTGDPDEPGACDTCDDVGKVVLDANAPSFLDADFGYRNPALADISGTVWNDPNRNAVIDAGETGFAGVTVVLLDSDGNVLATTTTAADGTYLFPGVPNGDYRVVVTDDAEVLNGLTLTSGLDSIPVNVAGADVEGVNFGYVGQSGTASIGDTVWLDANGDGLYQPNESGLSGVRVYLCTSSPCTEGNATMTTTTDANGGYLFSGLPAGNYFVGIDTGDIPANLTETTYIGGNGTTDQIALSDGQAFLNADFGFKPADGYAVLGDTVWYDVNGNGLQDPGEVGIGGVKVVVIDQSTGLIVAEVFTDADGSWLAIIPEDGTATNYVVFVDKTTLPDGVVTTPTNMGGGDTYIASVKEGDVRLNLDFGYTGGTPASIGDTVWLDLDGDGTRDSGEPGLSGVKLLLYTTGPDGIAGNEDDKLVGSTTTDANGEYIFTGLLPGEYYVVIKGVPAGLVATADSDDTGAGNNATVGRTDEIPLTAGETYLLADFGYQSVDDRAIIGDRIWSDANGDGVQDPGEAGIGGVTVRLCADAECTSVLRTTTTSADGSYLFTNVNPGTYFVVVSQPTGFTPTGDPDGCSGAPLTCVTPNVTSVTVSGGDEYLTADFGYQNLAGASGTIGDTIWRDDGTGDDGTAGDGIKNGDEPGIAGVTVSLISAGADGILGTADDVIVATTVTDSDGNYSFTGLPPGTYQVAVTDVGGALSGLSLTGQPDESTVSITCSPTCDTIDGPGLRLRPGARLRQHRRLHLVRQGRATVSRIPMSPVSRA